MTRARHRTLLKVFGFTALTLGFTGFAAAQPAAGQGPAAAGPPAGGADAPAAAGDAGQRAGGGGRGGRGAPAAIADGPWDVDTETGSVHVTVLTKDLQSPWSLVFLPDGDLLLTERPGRLRVIRDGKLDPTPIAGLPAIDSGSIGGLMGLALHPDFEDNRLIYFAYSKPNPADAGELTTAVARARWDGGAALENVEDIFVARDWYSSEMSSTNNRCCGQGPYNGSYGARIAFDDENRLYITSGDRNWGEKAQDPMSHLGKILRVNDDGSIPRDNPFRDRQGYLPEIYSLGHRNPTGLRFDEATGTLYSTEFGPAGGDEVNRIVAGGNYGWMLISNGNHYNDEPKTLGTNGIEGYIDPIKWWPRGGNPGNLIVYHGDEFPAWEGNIIVASMSPASLGPGFVRLTLDGSGQVVAEERMLGEIGQRMRDVAEGPDGRVYVLTESSAMASPGAIIVLEAGN
jgi:glucose/arabinose dehydrogenase